MLKEDFCLECNRNINKNIERGIIVISEKEIRDYHRDGGEAITLIKKAAKCFRSSDNCLYYMNCLKYVKEHNEEFEELGKLPSCEFIERIREYIYRNDLYA